MLCRFWHAPLLTTYPPLLYAAAVTPQAPHHSRASWMKFYRRHKHELNHTEEDEPLPQPPEKKMRYSRADDILLAKFFYTKPEGTSDKIFQAFGRVVSVRFALVHVSPFFACLRPLRACVLWVGLGAAGLAGREDRVADRSFVFRFCVCMCATRRCAPPRPALPASIRTIRGRGGKSTTGSTRRRSTTSSSASRTVRSSKTRRPRASSRRDKLVVVGWVR